MNELYAYHRPGHSQGNGPKKVPEIDDAGLFAVVIFIIALWALFIDGR
jgi:hypothetical protein